MFVVHGTKKFLERAKRPLGDPGDPTTALGNWCATAGFWKPQAAIFVNERTLMPIIVPLAPATSVLDRFPDHASAVFAALDLDRSFIDSEIAEMSECRLAKTNSRSLVGSMNEFAYLGKAFVTTAAATIPSRLRSNWQECPVGLVPESRDSRR